MTPVALPELPEPHGWLHDAGGNDPLTFVRVMPRMTADQVFEQKVSWCFGQLGQDSQLTKDDVRRVLLAQSGFKDHP